MKLCPVIPEICRGHVHVPKKERKIIIIIRRRHGEKNLPHTTFPPARFPSNKKFAYFLQSPYLFTIDQLFPLIVEMFCFNFYRVFLDFSFRNTKLIVVYVIERITTPTRWTPALQQTGSRNLTDQKTLAYTKYMFNVHKNQQSRQTGSRNLMDAKTLLTIWGTYMKLVTKYQISAINSCWEKMWRKMYIYVQCV